MLLGSICEVSAIYRVLRDSFIHKRVGLTLLGTFKGKFQIFTFTFFLCLFVFVHDAVFILLKFKINLMKFENNLYEKNKDRILSTLSLWRLE